MEHSTIAGDVDQRLYPAAALIDDLRHYDLPVRLNAIQNLGTIAIALGPERTREELIPFMQELIDDDDDILMAMAEQLGQGVEWVGGSTHAHALLPPLEDLCNVEEVQVRDKATATLRIIVGQMSNDQVQRHFCALIK